MRPATVEVIEHESLDRYLEQKAADGKLFLRLSEEDQRLLLFFYLQTIMGELCMSRGSDAEGYLNDTDNFVLMALQSAKMKREENQNV